MSPTRSRKVPLGFTLALCTAFLFLIAPRAHATATADIQITKSSDVSTVSAGGTITYTITATNLGPNGASQVVIEDDVPTTLTNIQISSVTQPSQCTVVGNTITCNMQGLGASGSINTIVFTADVVGSTESGTTITNCAFELSSNSNDPDHTNDSSPFSCGQGVSVVQLADMQVVKTQTDPLPANNPALGGTDVTYHIEATNNGPSAAAGVTVGDSLTSGTALYEGIANVSTGLDCSSNTNTVGTAFVTFTCTATGTGDPLASGSSLSFDLTLRMPNDGTLSITNQGSTATTTDDPDTSNNTSSVTTTICKSVDLAITKIAETVCPPSTSVACPVSIDSIQGGNNLQYVITVTNNDADNAASNVVVTDTLPTGITYVSDDASCDTSLLPKITCSTSSVAAGGGTFVIHIVVTAKESGSICNTASVSSDECDRNTADNSSEKCVTVLTNNMPTALEADREGCTNVSSPFCTGDADSVATDSDVNRVFEPNEIVRVDPAWTNTLDNAESDVTGTIDALSFTGPAGADYTILDGTADYGAIPAHTQADCNAATGDCYGLQIVQTSGTRPHNGNTQPVHWDAQFSETLSSGETHTWQLHIGDSFTDVPRSDIFYRAVETIYHNHITAGCADGTVFCPFAFTRRDEMAAFITRSVLGLDSLVPSSEPTVYDCTDGTGTSQFVDVPAATAGFCRHINYLKFIKLTAGCTDATHFCPDNSVTRGQLAVFVAGGMEILLGNSSDPLGSVPLWKQSTDLNREYNCTSSAQIDPDTSNSIPANTQPTSVSPAFSFTDVPATDVAGSQCPFIGFLFVNHVVSGDGAAHYFPNALVKRDETAAILSNAFVTIPLYGPAFFTPLP